MIEPSMSMLNFPDGFLWGAATSAFQVEGDAARRGRCIWDDFCDQPGNVESGNHGRHACRHVEHLDEDLRLIATLGLGAYRFSVSWARVLPEGTGRVSEPGLGFYDRLVDGLLEAGCVPFCTLYHWDLPSTLQSRGGWLAPDMPEWFADYAGIVAQRLGDRVRHWMTLNEPQVFLKLGMMDGVHAPGQTVGIADGVRASHHAVLAHLWGTAQVRAHTRDALIGPAPVAVVGVPATDAPRDCASARAFTLGVTTPDLWNNTWHLDPVLLGQYPVDGLAHFETHLPAGWERALERAFAPTSARSDFLGLNVYTGPRIGTGPDGQPMEVDPPAGAARTSFGWTIEPSVLDLGPRLLSERYGLPMYITENGLANNDWVGLDGRVDDPQRIDFTTRYLASLHRGIASGADVRGYFHWTLLDNFEWAEGYAKRFGLVHVDFPTSTRTPKSSAAWYAQVCRSNMLSLPDPDLAGEMEATSGPVASVRPGNVLEPRVDR